MEEARVLYRSVSIPELADILNTGKIMGGGNRFNFADDWPFVFFADQLNDLTIGQGEDIVRQARFALHDHERARQSDALQDGVERLARRIISEMNKDRLRYARSAADDFLLGFEARRFRAAAFRHPGCKRRKYVRLFGTMTSLKRQQRRVQEEFNELFATTLQRLRQEAAAAPYTSAVIVTKPINGGLLYSSEFGLCGLGEREYGFRPMQVGIRDIAEVLLVKDGSVIGRCNATRDSLANINE